MRYGIILALFLFLASPLPAKQLVDGVVANGGDWVSSGDDRPTHDPKYKFKIPCQLQLIGPWNPVEQVVAIANLELSNNKLYVQGKDLKWHYKAFDGAKFSNYNGPVVFDTDLQKISLVIFEGSPLKDAFIITHYFYQNFSGHTVLNSKSVEFTLPQSKTVEIENHMQVSKNKKSIPTFRSHLLCYP